MGEECGLPVSRAVTAITVHSCREVISGLECGCHSSPGRVALHTLRGSSPKKSLKVASFTQDLCMTAGERKARRTVIDLDIGTVPTLCVAMIWQTQAGTEHERT